MRMQQEKRPLAEIRSYIDSYYSRYGTPTDAEPVNP